MAELATKRARANGPDAPGGGFFGGPNRIQRKCAGCGEGAFFAAPESPTVRRQEAPGGEAPEPELETGPEIQPQLEVGAIDDPMEAEADRIADKVVRRQAAGPTASAGSGTLQAKSAAESATGPARPELADGIARARGSGAPLAPELRDRMEQSFGLDLSPVRLHTGPASARLNESIGARAFTYGTDIHFNSGQFAPNSPDGTHLLAHELTHVVQQTRGLRRKPKPADALVQRKPKLPEAPRKQVGFGPAAGYPKGAAIHKESLPKFVKDNIANKFKPAKGTKAAGGARQLFIEPITPGANKSLVAAGLRGEPDFYTAKSVVGLNESFKKTVAFGGLNVAKSQRGPTPPSGKAGPVGNFDKAPVDITLGDLKPGYSAEEFLGTGQLDNYKQGILNTASAVNRYMDVWDTHKNTSGTPSPRWHPNPVAKHEAQIPAILQEPKASGGVWSRKLAVYDFRNGVAEKKYSTNLKGSLVVYKSTQAGIYNYEWVPESAPASLDTSEIENLVQALDRDVVPIVRTKRKVARAPARPAVRRKAAAPALRRQVNRPIVQRTPQPHKKFDEKKWKKQYPAWQKTARDKFEKSAKSEFTVAAVENVNRRRRKKVTGSAALKTASKKFHRGRHWYNHGGKYAWFRRKFDKIYLKIQGFVTKVKKKFASLRKGGGSSFAGWAKAAAQALMKVVKLYASWALDQIADKLVGSLQTGIGNITNYLINDVLPEGAKSAVEKVQQKKAEIEGFAQSVHDRLENSVFGDALRFVKNLKAFEDIANTIGTIISVVEWGIRIAACGAPPLVGCLWNLAMSALQWAFSKIMQTCWFQKEVYGWFKSMRSNKLVKPFYDFPQDMAKLVVENANKLIPLPEGMPKVFGPIDGVESKDPDCSSGGGGSGSSSSLSPEQQALVKLMSRLEAQEKGKFAALMKMLAANAPEHATALDAARIEEMAKFAGALSKSDLDAIAAGKKTGLPAEVSTFLKNLATPSKADKAARKARKIDYDKAREWNPKYQKALGFDPEKFVRKGVTPGSKEFADAVYDVQKQLGMKADGMVGKWTVKKLYDTNKLEKDGAYRKAASEIQRHQAAIAFAKEYKQVNDMPWPSAAQMAKDLGGVAFPAAGGSIAYDVGKIKLVAMRTKKGSKAGFYYRVHTFTPPEGKPYSVMFFSRGLAVDTLAKGDGYVLEFVGDKGSNVSQGFIFNIFEKDLPKGQLFDVGG